MKLPICVLITAVFLIECDLGTGIFQNTTQHFVSSDYFCFISDGESEIVTTFCHNYVELSVHFCSDQPAGFMLWLLKIHVTSLKGKQASAITVYACMAEVFRNTNAKVFGLVM